MSKTLKYWLVIIPFLVVAGLSIALGTGLFTKTGTGSNPNQEISQDDNSDDTKDDQSIGGDTADSNIGARSTYNAWIRKDDETFTVKFDLPSGFRVSQVSTTTGNVDHAFVNVTAPYAGIEFFYYSLESLSTTPKGFTHSLTALGCEKKEMSFRIDAKWDKAPGKNFSLTYNLSFKIADEFWTAVTNKIKKPINLKSSYDYTGSEIKPGVTGKSGSITYDGSGTKGSFSLSNLKVDYANNTNPGIARCELWHPAYSRTLNVGVNYPLYTFTINKLDWKKVSLGINGTITLYSGQTKASKYVEVDYNGDCTGLCKNGSSTLPSSCYNVSPLSDMDEPGDYEWACTGISTYFENYSTRRILKIRTILYLDTPTLAQTSYPYNGKKQTVQWEDYDTYYYSHYVDKTGTESATAPGRNRIKLKFKSSYSINNYRWKENKGGIGSYVYVYWEITDDNIADEPTASKDTFNYTGSTIDFYNDYLSFNSNQWKYDSGTKSASEPGNYSVTLRIKNKSTYPYYYKGSGIYKSSVDPTTTINWSIKSTDAKVPTQSQTDIPWTGSTINFSNYLSGYSSSVHSLSGITSAKNLGSYTIYVGVQNTSQYPKWSDGTSSSSKKSYTFKIVKATNSWTTSPGFSGVSGSGISSSPYYWTYTGSTKTPTGAAKLGTITYKYALSSSSTFSSTQPTDVGTYKMQAITPQLLDENRKIACDAITITKYFRIDAKKLSASKMPKVSGTYTYNGSQQSVSLKNIDLNAMTVENNKQTNAGTYKVKVSLKTNSNGKTNIIWSDNTAGVKYFDWTIAKLPLSSTSIACSMSENSFGYNGQDQIVAIQQKVSLKLGTKTLTQGTDYDLTCYNNSGGTTKQVISKGTYYFKATAKSSSTNFTGSTSTTSSSAQRTALTFKITNPQLSQCTITGQTTFTFNNKSQSPLDSTSSPSFSVKSTSLNKALVRASSYSGTGDYYVVGTYKTGTTTSVSSFYAGTYDILIKPTSSSTFEGEARFTFIIKPTPILSISLSFTEATYNTKQHIPEEIYVYYKYGNQNYCCLFEDYNFTLKTSGDFTNVTTAGGTITVTGKGNYTGSASAKVTIKPYNLSGATINLASSSYTYNNQAKKPTVSSVTATQNGVTFTVPSTNYSTSYSNNVNAGSSAKVIISSRSSYKNFTGRGTKTFSISTRDISNTTIGAIDDQDYTGNAVTPTLSVSDTSIGVARLKAGTDYYIGGYKSYVNGSTWGPMQATIIQPGTYKAYVYGKGNYSGAKYTGLFKIKQSSFTTMDDSLLSISVLNPNSYIYTGGVITPSVTVKINEAGNWNTLTQGTHYTVVSTAKSAGAQTAKIVGRGNYSGEKSFDFTIQQASISGGTFVLDETKYTYNGFVKKPKGTLTLAGFTSTNLSNELNNSITYSYLNSSGIRVDPSEAGTYTVRVTGKGNFKGSKDAIFVIEKVDLDDPSSGEIAGTLSATLTGDLTYTGSMIQPGITNVKLTFTENGVRKTVNVSSADYTCSYGGSYDGKTYDNINVSSGGIVMLVMKTSSNFSGKLVKTFEIKPRPLAQYVTVIVDGTSSTSGKISVNYTGLAHNYSVIIKDNLGNIVSQTTNGNTNYTLSGTSYSNSKTSSDLSQLNWTDVGTIEIDATPQGNYTYYSGQLTSKAVVIIVPKSGSGLTFNADSVTYNGKAQTPSFTIKDGNKQLYKGTDYKLDTSTYSTGYSNNINAGTGKVHITFMNNYTGNVGYGFTISQKSILDATIGTIEDATYTTESIRKTPSVVDWDLTISSINDAPYITQSINKTSTLIDSYGNKSIINSSDYDFTFSRISQTSGFESSIDFDFVSSGTIWVKVTGKNNYTDSVVRSYKINRASPSSGAFDALSDLKYNGDAQTPNITFRYGSDVITQFDTISYKLKLPSGNYFEASEARNVGTYQVSVKMKSGGNYTTEEIVVGEFSITPKDINDSDVSINPSSIEDQRYTGEPIKPSITGVQINKGNQITSFASGLYDVTYGTNVNIGTKAGSVIITGKANLKGTRVIYFNIVARPLDDVVYVEDLNTPEYTGSAITLDSGLTFSVKDLSKTLKRGTDWQVKSYENNINAGKETASVVIKGMGNYSGEKTITFSIKPKNISGGNITGITAETQYTGSEIQQTSARLVLNEKTYEQNLFSVTYKDNINLGMATIIFAGTNTEDLKGSGNYSGQVSATWQIITRQVNLSSCTFNLKANSTTYNTQPQKPVIASLIVAGKSLTADDYDVEYIRNAGTDVAAKTEDFTNAGSIVVRVVAKAGDNRYNFSADVQRTYVINKRSFDSVKIEIEAQEYTGSSIHPVPTVTDTEGSIAWTLTYSTSNPNSADNDYTISYGTNLTEKGTVTITGKRNYTGTKSIDFVINTIKLSDVELVVSEVIYNRQDQKPVIKVVKAGNFTLLDSEYKVDYLNAEQYKNGSGTEVEETDFVNAKTIIVKVSVKDNVKDRYTGFKVIPFVIKQSEIAEASLNGEPNPVYNAKVQKQGISTINSANGLSLIVGTDYNITYYRDYNTEQDRGTELTSDDQFKDIGVITVRVGLSNNFTKSEKDYFILRYEIKQKDITEIDVEKRFYFVKADDKTVFIDASGSETFTTSNGEKIYKSGDAYFNEDGTPYTGSKENLTRRKVYMADEQVYLGQLVEPEIIYYIDVNKNGKFDAGDEMLEELTQGTDEQPEDYIFTFKKTSGDESIGGVGETTLTVAGKGNYKETYIKVYKIAPQEFIPENIDFAFNVDVSIIGKLEKQSDSNRYFVDEDKWATIKEKSKGFIYTGKEIEPLESQYTGQTEGSVGILVYNTVSHILLEYQTDYNFVTEVEDTTAGVKKVTANKKGYINNINAGTATILLKGSGGSYNNENIIVNFKILPQDISLPQNILLDKFEFSVDNQTYTGMQITPKLTTAKFNSTDTIAMSEGKDYNLIYGENINVNRVDNNPNGDILNGGQVIIKGNGNFSGERVMKFKINPKNILDKTSEVYDVAISGMVERFKNNGNTHEQDPLLKYLSNTLTKGIDYILSYKEKQDENFVTMEDLPIKTNEYKLVITAQGNYTGVREESFMIIDKEIVKVVFVDYTNNQEVSAVTFNDKEQKAYIKVYDEYGAPVNIGNYNAAYYVNDQETDTDYKSLNWKDAGKITVKLSLVSGSGYYCDERINATYTIKPKPLEQGMVSNIDSSYNYTGLQIKPVPTVSWQTIEKEVVLEASETGDKDYTITYGENTESDGGGQVYISGTKNYVGTVVITFTINKMDISGATFGKLADRTYTGYPQKPVDGEFAGLIKWGEVELEQGKHFSVNYNSNENWKDAGNYNVNIIGKGSFVGSKTITCIINKKAIGSGDIIISSVEDQKYTGQQITPTPAVLDTSITDEDGQHATISVVFEYENNIYVAWNNGEVQSAGVIRIKEVKDSNYIIEENITKGINFKIVPKSIEDSDVVVGNYDKTPVYTGSRIMPEITIDWNNMHLIKYSEDTGKGDYKVTYGENVNVGDGSFTITAVENGNYIGEVTIMFTIVAVEIELDKISITFAADPTYDNVEHILKPEVVYDTVKLTEGIDYDLIYPTDVISAGEKAVQITLKGNYHGQPIAGCYNILKKDVKDVIITGLKDREFNGEKALFEIEATDNTLASESKEVKLENYVVLYSEKEDGSEATEISPAKSGVYYVVINGQGNYKGTKIVGSFKIERKSLEQIMIDVIENVEYNGQEQKPEIIVEYNEISYDASNFEVIYSNNINAGTATVVIRALDEKRNFVGEIETSFVIDRKQITRIDEFKWEIITPEGGFVYNRMAFEPKMNITPQGLSVLNETEDYKLRYENNTNISTEESKAKIIIEFTRNYIGEVYAEFEIVARNIAEVNVTGIHNPIFDRKSHQIVPELKYRDVILTDEDYEYDYYRGESKITGIETQFINQGEITIKIKGKNNFGGETEVQYTIEKRSLSEVEIEIKDGQSFEYNAEVIKPKILVRYAGVEIVQGEEIGVEYTGIDKEGKTRDNRNVMSGGLIRIIPLNEEVNWKEVGEVTFKITPKEITGDMVTPIAKVTYDGSLKKPKVEIKYTINETEERLVQKEEGVERFDFYVEYSNNRNVTTEAKAEIKTDYIEGISGNYSGSLIMYFRIAGCFINSDNVQVLWKTASGDYVENYSVDYTGEEQTPEFKLIIKEDKREMLSEDFIYEFKNNINVTNMARLEIIGQGDYIGEPKFYFNITQKDISKIEGLFSKIEAQEYTGREITVNLLGKYLNQTLVEDKGYGGDFDAVYGNNINVLWNQETGLFISGAVVTITGKGNYKGQIVINFTITPAKIDRIELKKMEVEYNGTEQKASFDVYAGLIRLSNTDFTVSYSNQDENWENAGDITIIVKASEFSNYQGTMDCVYKILRKDIGTNGIIVEGVRDKVYDYGKAIMQDIVVWLNDIKLNDREDYEVSYNNNLYAGAATITITGKGNYEGIKVVGFNISKIDPTVHPKLEKQECYAGDVMPSLILADGDTAGEIVLQGDIVLQGENDYLWTFVPADTKNFNNITGYIRLNGIAVFATEIKIGGDYKKIYNAYDKFNSQGVVIKIGYNNGAEDVIDGSKVVFLRDGDILRDGDVLEVTDKISLVSGEWEGEKSFSISIKPITITVEFKDEKFIEKDEIQYVTYEILGEKEGYSANVVAIYYYNGQKVQGIDEGGKYRIIAESGNTNYTFKDGTNIKDIDVRVGILYTKDKSAAVVSSEGFDANVVLVVREVTKDAERIEIIGNFKLNPDKIYMVEMYKDGMEYQPEYNITLRLLTDIRIEDNDNLNVYNKLTDSYFRWMPYERLDNGYIEIEDATLGAYLLTGATQGSNVQWWVFVLAGGIVVIIIGLVLIMKYSSKQRRRTMVRRRR